MKTLISISALALISNMAVGETFQYERQLASQDLDPNIPSLSEGISNPSRSVDQPRISLHEVYRGNPDTDTGSFEPAAVRFGTEDMPTTAYEAIVKGNPDLEV